MKEKYYLGLDMGTSSLGWAVTDEKYCLLRKKGKDLWGVRLFDEADTAAERRSHRTARRRLQREKARIGYLRELFSEEINKIDAGFFQRLEDSKYYVEDKREHQPFTLFADKGYTDREYFEEFPTIFHLRKALLDVEKQGSSFDVRLVYLAILNMFKHRGHFLNANLDDKSGGDLKEKMNILTSMADKMLDAISFKAVDIGEIEQVLASKDYSNSIRLERLLDLFELSKTKNKVETEIFKMICGLKGTISKIFKNENMNEEAQKLSISFRDGNYDEKIMEVEEVVSEESFEFLMIMKQIHDWAVLSNIMMGEEYLSVARVKSYEKHKKDLMILKTLLKNYSIEEYNNMFRVMKDNNYSAYIGSVISKEGSIRREGKYNLDDFYKNVKSAVSKCRECGEKEYILSEIEKRTFLPKQITASNGVIPNQVHKKELKRILENAAKYLEFLNDKDDTGLTVSEKIVRLFEFQIPYYVGPLSNGGCDGKNVWSVRREKGAVLPWNFEEKIDVKQSSENFITNLVNHCTYLNGETVLPKNSLLYEKYMVLNELNNLKINGIKIGVELKQSIYNDVFKKGKKVTAKALIQYLKNIGEIDADEEAVISGIDGDFTNRLANYRKFVEIFEVPTLTYEQEQMAESIIFYSTVYGESKKFLEEKIRENYSDKLSEKQIKRILGLKFKDWGRLSKELLQLQGIDKQTGEISSIISKMWNDNYNLMELIATDKFSYREDIEEKTSRIEKVLSDIEYSDLDELYISAPVKRMVWQTILVLKELEKVMKCEPEKIFVEMSRDANAPKKRTESRKKKFLELYKACKKESRDWKEELENTEESKLRSKKLYLYYTQKGRCMYSGEEIELKDLFNDNLYDIDHIYPRHFVKDDSIENNLVLVRKVDNAYKSDAVLESAIREKMRDFWKILCEGNFITDEKYKRLMRTEDFSDEERAGFISRQIVETRQGTKVIADLFTKTFPESEIIYVKAGNVSDFRKQFDLIKCRIINDFHHAQDAYLNIVVGNVYNTKFTQNPINFIREYNKDPKANKYHMEKLFQYPVSRNGKDAWITKNAESISMVKRMMGKNTPLVTRMNYESHGGIADQTIYSANDAKNAKGKGYIPVKSSDQKLMDTCKYGGMKKYTGTYFLLLEHTKKGKRIRTLEAMPLYLKDKLDTREKVEKYFEQSVDFAYEQPKVILDKIKMYSLLKVDGFYLYLTGRTGEQLSVCNAVQMSLNTKMTEYVRKISMANERYTLDEEFEKDGNISIQKNLKLYDVLKDKHLNQIYRKRPNPVGEKLDKGVEAFRSLSVKKQIYVLLQILQLSQLSNQGADLLEIGGEKKTGTSKLNKKITGKQQFKLINQSVTGLYENEIDLLTI
jgi:CRISPR-associated endonuclease Csn1